MKIKTENKPSVHRNLQAQVLFETGKKKKRCLLQYVTKNSDNSGCLSGFWWSLKALQILYWNIFCVLVGQSTWENSGKKSTDSSCPPTVHFIVNIKYW